MNCRVIAPSLVVFLVACGGNVVFESSNSSGNGGGGNNAGSGCEQYCEKAAGCPDIPVGDQCVSGCEEGRALYVDAGCEDAFDAFLGCLSNLPDVCTPDANACLSEINALGTCFGGFDDGGSGGFG
jgi:hypothetical protein